MDDKEKSRLIAEMIDRRKAAIRQKLWDDTALRMLAEHGTLSVEDVNAAVDEQISYVTDEQLADQIAAKTRSAILYHQGEIASAETAVANAAEKVDKFKGLVENCINDLENLKDELDATRQRLSDAEELAEYAAQLGNADAAPEPTNKSANAGSATGEVNTSGKGGTK